MNHHWLSQFNLNDKQEEAVTYVDGPLFVIAGAGTGKTKTLTTKIAYLIHEHQVVPSRILAFTFTNKAAKEIKERTESVVDVPIYGMWLNTFHAFGLRILREEIEHLDLGYSKSFSVIDEDDVLKIIRDIIKSQNIDTKKYSAKKARGIISSLKTMDYLKAEDDVYQKIADLYQKELVKNQLLDFDDLIVYTRSLLIEKPDVLLKYQEKFDYILVDEFQDTDKLQYDIIYLLGLRHRKIFLVGDPDQSIYGFRGANYENSSKFIKDYQAKIAVLDLNYRSTNEILDKANKLIAHNVNRPKAKNLKSEFGMGDPVIVFQTESDYQEAQYVMMQIENLINQGYRYQDIAILYRHNALSRMFEDQAIRFNIPYVIYGGISFYERREVKDILAYIRIILNPHQDFYLKRIINVPKRQIGNTTVEALENEARFENLSMFDTIQSVETVKGKTKERLQDFRKLILEMTEEIEMIEDMADVITYIANTSGYLEYLKLEGDEIARERSANVMELASVFSSNERYYEGSRRDKMMSILDQIALYTDKDKDVSHFDSIKLSTYHQVKGLEFPVVFMVVMEQGVFPDERAYETLSDLEEERRVAYVGMTRAKKRLYLTYASRRMLYGIIRQNERSAFIKEAFKDQTNQVFKTPPKAINRQDARTYGIFKKGDKVDHTIFGEGVVVDIGDEIVKVAFKMPHGIKSLSENHPALKKIK